MEINYYGYLTPYGGYGIANLNWIDNLLDHFKVNIKLQKTLGEKEMVSISQKFPRVYEAMQEPFSPKEIGIIETTPFNFHLNESKIKIANTMAETDEISGEWVKSANFMDQIIVPNEFYKKVFYNSGVNKPITVIPHGVDSDFWQYKERSNEVFTFGIAGYLNERKGWQEVVKAFVNEFKADEPVRLRIHSTNPETMFYTRWRDSRIESDHGYFTFEKLRDFYYKLNCFVFPSRAEGIGYPPREAMATGIPSIIMNYSGLSDLNIDVNYVLEPDGFEKNINPVAEQPGNWAKINILELRKLMRKAYDDRNNYRRGLDCSHYIQSNYSWRQVTIKMKNFIEGL